MNLALKHSAIFLLYLLLQIFVFNHFTIFGMATAHVFLLALLIVPVTVRFSILIAIGFFAGLMVDMFSVGSYKGIHAFSCVLMLSLRDPWISLITNRVAYRGSEEYLLQVQPAIWYVQYLFPMIFIHQAAYYFLEAFSFNNFGFTLAKIGTSTLFTFAICLLFTTLIHRVGKK